MNIFQVGDTVTWNSQSSGHHTTKIGVIVRVVSGNDDPKSIAASFFPDHKPMFDSRQVLLGYKSAYLISVPYGPSGKAKPRLYMPRPKLLQKYD